MAKALEQKTKISAGLTSRVVTKIQAEANRLGISFGDMLRRITDDWSDRQEAARAKPSDHVLVLDRETNTVRHAR